MCHCTRHAVFGCSHFGGSGVRKRGFTMRSANIGHSLCALISAPRNSQTPVLR